MVDIIHPRQECIEKMLHITASKIEERDKSLMLQFQLLKQELLNAIQSKTREEINWVFKIVNWLMPSLFAVVSLLIYKNIGG